MDADTVRRLGLILAVQAEIDGMKAANGAREERGVGAAYLEREFIAKADELRNLVYAPVEKL